MERVALGGSESPATRGIQQGLGLGLLCLLSGACPTDSRDMKIMSSFELCFSSLHLQTGADLMQCSEEAGGGVRERQELWGLRTW